MWPIQLALYLFVVHRMSLSTLTLSNTSFFTRSLQMIFSFPCPVTTFQHFPRISYRLYIYCFQFSDSRTWRFHITDTKALHLNVPRTTTIHGRIPNTEQSILRCELLFQDISQFLSRLLGEKRTVLSQLANSYLLFALSLPYAVSTYSYVCVQCMLQNKGKYEVQRLK
jgi:hypothetical protein